MAGPYFELRINAIDASLDTQAVNSIIEQITGKTVKGLSSHGEFRKEIGEEYLRIVSIFVPRKTGKLIASGKALRDGRIIYGNDTVYYASDQYTNLDYSHWEYDARLNKIGLSNTRQALWTQQLQPGTDAWEVLIREVTPIVTDYMERGVFKVK